MEGGLSAPGRGGYVAFAFSYESPLCMGLLHGRTGRLPAQNGGCAARAVRPGDTLWIPAMLLHEVRAATPGSVGDR